MKTKKHAVTLVLAVACVAVFTLMMGGTAMAAPTDPSGLTATAVSSSQIDLAWTASTGATGYEVYQSTDSTNYFWLCGNPTTNSFPVTTNLVPSTQYWFKVRAYDAVPDYSGYSNTANATTQAGTPPTTGAYSQVTGTVHNLAMPGVGVCATCHVVHNATGDLLWARSVGTTFTGIKALCYSCHDGSAANEQYAFDAAYAQHEGECNLCHDPHNNSYGSFLQFATGANVCNNCHSGEELGLGHPTNMPATMVPADVVFNPTADMSGTRLYNSAGTSTTGGTYVKCLTCHTAHGGVAGTRLNTMNYSAASAALCTNCHP